MLRWSSRPFLTARWADLGLVNYAVPPLFLDRFLPPGVEPDTLDGEAFVSLVAFDFLETRVAGVAWPGYVDFPELNLRFYVRHGHRRGVAFIRELVPQVLVAELARRLYNEPYQAAELSRGHAPDRVTTRLKWADGTHSVTFHLESEVTMPGEDTPEHFFKEHKWGYGRSRHGDLLEYKVLHPRWETRQVTAVDLDFDFGSVYGPEWTFLNQRAPHSTFFALGSRVAVFPPRVIT